MLAQMGLPAVWDARPQTARETRSKGQNTSVQPGTALPSVHTSQWSPERRPG